MDSHSEILPPRKAVSFRLSILPSIIIGVLLILAIFELSNKAFSTFFFYDDQGYIMLTLKHYRQGNALYDTVFSQYGPAYYIFRDWCYGQAEVTHDLTAMVSIGHAFLCCVLGGLITYTCTRNLWVAALVVAIMPSRVVAFFNESGHPQEFQCVLVLLATLVVVSPLQSATRACILGLLVGIITMVKINVGVFMLIPALLLLVGELPYGKLRSLFISILVIGFVASPFFLVRRHLFESWAFAFAFLISASLAPILLLTGSDRPRPNWKPLLLFSVGFGITISAILAHELSRGTSAMGLLRGILLQPLALSGLYVGAFPIGYSSIALATISLICFYVVWLRKCSMTMLCAACLTFCVLLCGLMLIPGARFFTKYLTPFIWIVPVVRLIRLRGNDSLLSKPSRNDSPQSDCCSAEPDRTLWQTRSGTGFLFVASIFLILQCYPVAGTQVSCGTILFPIVAALGLLEGYNVLNNLNFAWCSDRRRTVGMALLTLMFVGWRIASLAILNGTYTKNSPVNLPGMKHYRLPAASVAQIQWLVHGLERFPTFVCMPGFSSLYFWCQKEPPTTYINAGTWMTLLDDETQQKVVTNLRKFDSLGGFRWQSQINGWAQGRDISAKPLVKFINNEMQKFDEKDGFELLQQSPTDR